jgi:hypothetical protein
MPFSPLLILAVVPEDRHFKKHPVDPLYIGRHSVIDDLVHGFFSSMSSFYTFLESEQASLLIMSCCAVPSYSS